MTSGAIRAFWICLPLLLVATGLAVWNPAGDFWGSVEPPKAQCEAYSTSRLRAAKVLTPEIYDPQKLDRLLREPQNTVSNLAYVFVGLAVLLSSRRQISRSFGVAGVFLGLGSGIYHASLLPEWRMIDILGVYVVLCSLLIVGYAAAFRLAGRRFDFAATVAAWLAAVPAGIHRNDLRIAGFKLLDSTYVVVAAVSLGVVSVLLCWRHARGSRRYLLGVIALILAAPIAFFGGLADRFGGLLANPEALIQGHTLWHGFGTAAMLAAYEAFAATGFDRSVFERGPQRPTMKS